MNKLYKLPLVSKNIEVELPVVDENTVLVHAKDKVIEISLDNSQFKAIKDLGYQIEERNIKVPELCAYNPYVVSVQNPNNNYPTTPPKIVTYVLGGTETFNRNYIKSTIAGEIIQPTLQYYKVPKAWNKGWKGLGVKVCVVDNGFSNTHAGHEDLIVVDVYNPAEKPEDHHVARLGDIGARFNNKGVRGAAYECSLYAASYNNIGAGITWAVDNGCKLINCSFATEPDAYIRLAVKKAIDAGVIVCVSAGNSGTPTYINPMACISGVTIIGGSKGGGTNPFLDEFSHFSVIPSPSTPDKFIDFLNPSTTISCVTPVPGDGFDWDTPTDWYQTNGGTSSQGVLVGVFTLLCQKYPDLPGDVIIHLAKLRSKKVVINAVEYSVGIDIV